MLVSKEMQVFKKLKSQKLKCQVCGPNNKPLPSTLLFFQALEWSFATSFVLF